MWLSGLDQNVQQVAVTREHPLKKILSEDIILVGFHFPSGGIGRVVKSAIGYILIPSLHIVFKI